MFYTNIQILGWNYLPLVSMDPLENGVQLMEFPNEIWFLVSGECFDCKVIHLNLIG